MWNRNNVSSDRVKYLGVVLDDLQTFGEHTKAAVRKAEASTAALSRLMPNIGGPSSGKRAVLSGVAHSVLLYGAPIWYGAMRVGTYRKRMESAQRRVLLRVASAYRRGPRYLVAKERHG
ncbi:hypothetical protein JTB14_003906 [Gonioctena quinquepunctata]|nr:hypothetical protein JTB14_003906 [Gonioctena quinquepunctata]